MSQQVFNAKWWHLLLLVPIAVVGFWCGRDLPFADQWPVYDGLRQTSAIVFGICGAWIAIVYPAAMSTLLKKNAPSKTEESDAVGKLILPMELSTFVLVAILLLGLIAPVVRHLHALQAHYRLIQGLSFSLAAVLTVIQGIAVLFLLVPLDKVLGDVDRASARREAINKLRPLPMKEDDE